MMNLNEHAQKAQEIAFNRWYKNDVKYNTPAILKHCAGELADIITCALIAAANENIDIEKALQDCQQKNAQRAEV